MGVGEAGMKKLQLTKGRRYIYVELSQNAYCKNRLTIGTVISFVYRKLIALLPELSLFEQFQLPGM